MAANPQRAPSDAAEPGPERATVSRTVVKTIGQKRVAALRRKWTKKKGGTREHCFQDWSKKERKGRSKETTRGGGPPEHTGRRAGVGVPTTNEMGSYSNSEESREEDAVLRRFVPGHGGQTTIPVRRKGKREDEIRQEILRRSKRK